MDMEFNSAIPAQFTGYVVFQAKFSVQRRSVKMGHKLPPFVTQQAIVLLIV
jgi:hypothetical protein